ncbi:hypothetical protein CHUAL_003219 [Chamberlinius hualienensis]
MDYMSLGTPKSPSKNKNNRFNKRGKGKLLENSKDEINLKGVSHKSDNFKKTPQKYMGCDVKLIPRIRQYFQTCNGSKGFKADKVVDYLQQTFHEYKRKKKAAFRTAVLKAIDYVRGDEASESEFELIEGDLDPSISAMADSDFSADNENYTVYEDTNSANNTIRELYAKNPRNETGTTPAPTSKMPNKVETEPAENVTNNARGTKSSGKKKVKSREILPQRSTATFESIGGIEDCFPEICKFILHLKHPGIYQALGIPPPRGLLLHGPPGCGKTLLANAIAGELDIPFFKMAATELVSGVSGESEEQIRELFSTAVASAPSIIFLDEIDAITPKRETSQREMEKRIVSQLLTCMDDLNSVDMLLQVLVIGATNRPDSLDPALRRAGRFDREIRMGIPNAEARKRILDVLCKNITLSPLIDLMELAREAPGFVGADLMALIREAGLCALDRILKTLEGNASAGINEPSFNTQEMHLNENNDGAFSFTNKQYFLTWLRGEFPLTDLQLKGVCVELSDFKAALKLVQPSAKREGFATVPDVKWEDIGALRSVREELQLSIMGPIRHRKVFEKFGIERPVGILLWGPPGCGKTLLAKAIANESGINFISVKGPELLNMYLGESEKAVRQVFLRAQNSSPCVIFFDEMDAICPRRSESAENGASSRVVNQLLTEMDGISGREDVFIIGATNRFDILDPAVLRPGRLDKHLYVDLPTPEDRVDILNTITKFGTVPQLSPEVSLKNIGMDERCSGFTGADLTALIQSASLIAIKELISCDNTSVKLEESVVRQVHFEKAFECTRRSVSPLAQLEYEAMRRMVEQEAMTKEKIK